MPMSRKGLVVAVAMTLTLFGSWIFAVHGGEVQNRRSARRPLSVYDAHGVRVGEIIGTAQAQQVPIVGLRTGDFVVALLMWRDHFIGTSRLFFTSDNCLGEAFLTPEGNATPGFFLLPVTAVVNPGHSLYIPDPSGIPQDVTSLSNLSGAGGSCQ